MSREKPIITLSKEKLAYIEKMLLKKAMAHETAKKTDTHEVTLYEWLKKYQENPREFMSESGNLKEYDKEVNDFEKRIKELEKGNQFFKKATAYFVKNPV